MNEKPSDESQSDDPKIIVDTDWKEQVARERDAATEDAESASKQPEATNSTDDLESNEASTGATSDETSDSLNSPTASAPESREPPPASFSVLVSMLFTQAMAMLGQMPDPGTGETSINKPFAKHHIDTLEMLESKTKGNLDEEESAMLREALHALRMMYVDTRS